MTEQKQGKGKLHIFIRLYRQNQVIHRQHMYWNYGKRIRRNTSSCSGGYILCEVGGVADFLYPTSKLRRGRVQGGGQICPTLTSENTGVCKVEKNIKAIDEQNMNIRDETFGTLTTDGSSPKHNNRVLEEPDWSNTEYRIRKLTPRECYRLQNVAENDIDKMEAIVSKTQQYKMAGNSIVVAVLIGVFSQLNIKGITPWNEMSLDEKYELIFRGCLKHNGS